MGMAYGNGVIVAAGRQTSGTTTYPVKVYTSTNGTSWTERTNIIATNQNVNDLIFHNGYFFICLEDGTTRRSTNGTSWTTMTVPGQFLQFATDGKYIYSVGSGGTNILNVYRSTNNGSAWTTLGSVTITTSSNSALAVGFGKVITCSTHSASPFYIKLMHAEYDSQVLTLSGNQNLGTTGGINVNNLVRMSGTTNTYARVVSISAGTNNITIASPTTFLTGRTLVSTQPVGTATSQRLYLLTDSGGNISDMQSADPGFVNYGPGTSVTLKFPATFPTGNAPDTELPSGTTVRAEIQATNTVASDTELSNIVTPT
jgi:hypothetical protein